MDLGAITQALGGLLGGGQQEQRQAAPQTAQAEGGGGFNINPAVVTALLPAVMSFVNSKGGIQGVMGLFGGGSLGNRRGAAEGDRHHDTGRANAVGE